jgi:competence protein ComEC
MRCALLMICAGIASAATVSDVQFARSLVLGISIALVMGLLILWRLDSAKFIRRPFLLLLFLLLGIYWHLHWADARLGTRLAERFEGQTLQLDGVVTGLPERSAIAQQFHFLVLDSPADFRSRKVVLNYYGDRSILPGQNWRFSVRLNRPHGYSNPGGFDYEAWLMQQGVDARGYVRSSSANSQLPSMTMPPRVKLAVWISTARYAVKLRLQQQLGQLRYGDLFIALLLGDRSAISQEHWQLFTATGTNHLFVISGLHIGMISGFVYWIVLLGGKMFGIALFVPAQKFAAVFALLAALAYAMLAGFSLPTQRAFIMIAVLISGVFWSTRYQVSFRLILALFFILLLNPLAWLSSGFWLSFIAVAALVMFTDKSPGSMSIDSMEYPAQERIIKLVELLIRPQLIVFVALAVPLVFFTQQISLLAPAVNVLAIPIVGFLIVPLCFIAVGVSFVHLPTAILLMSGSHLLLSLLIESLLLVVQLSREVLQLQMIRPNASQLYALFLAALILLLPKAVCRRSLILPLLVSVLPIPQSLRSNSEQSAILRLHVVDVGQGLAVIIQTQNHVLLYDAGAQLGPDFNIGAAVVAPALRTLGISELDTVVISHGDNDHAGGLPGVEQNIGIERLISNERRGADAMRTELCTQLSAWNWDGVEFHFLHTGLDSTSENNSSCVLQLRFLGDAILLPGDIEAEAELNLVLIYGEQLASTLLLAPHHGSQSSSSYALLKQVRPRYVVFSAGYRNSFGHPHDRVVARYAEFGSHTLNTADSGMISVVFAEEVSSEGTITQIIKHREENSRYWH